MTAPFRLGLLIMPSPYEMVWRLPIAHAAVDHGLTLAKSLAAYVSQGHDANGVLIVDAPSDVLHFNATDWVVLGAPTQVIADALFDRIPQAPSKMYRRMSEQLTTQHLLVERGARVLDSLQPALDLPGLGRVERPEAPPLSVSGTDLAPVAMLETLPPPVGARARWSVDLFNIKAEKGALLDGNGLDLTGRARVIVHGPRFSLPTGRWRITTQFVVDVEDSDVYLRFEWGNADDMEAMDVMLQQSGSYQISLDHDWGFPGEAELRIWASNAHFIGAIEFLGAEVEKIGESEIAVAAPAPALQIEMSGRPS